MLYLLASLAAFGLLFAAVWGTQRHFGATSVWYGLTFVGAAAAIVAQMTAMGAWIAWAYAGGIELDAGAKLGHRTDVILITTWLLGGLTEVAKSYGVKVFDVKITRDQWAFYAIPIGLGAAMATGIWEIGTVGAAIAVGHIELSAEHWMLLPRMLAGGAMHVAVGMLVMWFVAAKSKSWGWMLGALLHGGALFVGLQLSRGVPELVLYAKMFGYLGAAALAATALRAAVQRRGWPV